MEEEKIQKVQWILEEIGKEVDEKTGKNDMITVVFPKFRRHVKNLIGCLKSKSYIEARTEYYAAILHLAQIGHRYEFNSMPAEEPKKLNLSNLKETLEKATEHLYNVCSDNYSADAQDAIDLLDSVILEIEINEQA